MRNSNRVPGQNFPSVILLLLGGGQVDISKPCGELDWKLILIYHANHCRLCNLNLVEQENAGGKFSKIGIDLLAVPAPNKARAEAQLAEIEYHYPVAFGLSRDQIKVLVPYI